MCSCGLSVPCRLSVLHLGNALRLSVVSLACNTYHMHQIEIAKCLRHERLTVPLSGNGEISFTSEVEVVCVGMWVLHLRNRCMCSPVSWNWVFELTAGQIGTCFAWKLCICCPAATLYSIRVPLGLHWGTPKGVNLFCMCYALASAHTSITMLVGIYILPSAATHSFASLRMLHKVRGIHCDVWNMHDIQCQLLLATVQTAKKS